MCDERRGLGDLSGGRPNRKPEKPPPRSRLSRCIATSSSSIKSAVEEVARGWLDLQSKRSGLRGRGLPDATRTGALSVRTATRQAKPAHRTFALIAAQQIMSYFILIKVISGRRRARPNATWQTALNSALCPATTKGTGIGKSSRTATRSLRAALLTRSALHANRQTKRREKQS
jgi:hypothetical protein